MSTLAKLRSVRVHLATAMPTFKWTAMSAKEIEEEGSLDPPCALVRGKMGPFRIDLHVDGEGTVGFHCGGDVADTWIPGCIDMKQRPEQIAQNLLAVVGNLK